LSISETKNKFENKKKVILLTNSAVYSVGVQWYLD
jgi:hypothetical protein